MVKNYKISKLTAV